MLSQMLDIFFHFEDACEGCIKGQDPTRRQKPMHLPLACKD